MKKVVLAAAVNSLAFYASSLLLPEIKLDTLSAAVAAGILLAILVSVFNSGFDFSEQSAFSARVQEVYRFSLKKFSP